MPFALFSILCVLTDFHTTTQALSNTKSNWGTSGSGSAFWRGVTILFQTHCPRRYPLQVCQLRDRRSCMKRCGHTWPKAASGTSCAQGLTVLQTTWRRRKSRERKRQPPSPASPLSPLSSPNPLRPSPIDPSQPTAHCHEPRNPSLQTG